MALHGFSGVGLAYWQRNPGSKELNHTLHNARPPKQDKFELILPKIKLALDRGYVTMFVDKELMAPWESDMSSSVESFVPKADDTNLMYNGRGCSLNVRAWAPTS
jgi:hypothetical protein